MFYEPAKRNHGLKFNPFKALVYFSSFFEQPWRELFQGSPILVPDMPRRYVAQLFWLTLPEITLALGLVGAALATLAACDRTRSAQRRAVLIMIALSETLPIARRSRRSNRAGHPGEIPQNADSNQKSGS